MALFTDANVVTLEDLLQFETTLVQVASSHGINVETKINLSINAISDKLLLWLLDTSGSDPQWTIRKEIGLSTIVVTPTLKRWLCFDALARFFSEAYNVQLNTRFQGKWTEYQVQAEDASRMVFMSGLGIVYSPLPRPALPLVSVQNGTASAQSIFVQTAWTDMSGNESALSPVNGQILGGASDLVVGMAEGALNVPLAASGWNLYASTSEDGLTRQNSMPLSIGSTWKFPNSGLIAGAAALDGQVPDSFIQLTRRILRG